MSIEATLARMRSYRKTSGLTPTALAKKAGLGINTLLDMDSTEWSPALRTIQQLEAIIPVDFDK